MNNQNLTLSITLATGDIARITNAPQELLTMIPSDQWDTIQDLIVGALDDQDGSPQLDEVEIGNLEYHENIHQGTFRMFFLIHRRFCCSEQVSWAKDYVDWTFSIQQDKLLATAAYFNWTLDN
ncbi:hypothetical protein [Sphingobacterium sp. SYP-B4668]|uniref:hypothetical protein n=1 Tax=Sphingobacterium sp. SYP-B4668 TaxID=2996035 RepID=UPI00053249F9|nr:hypothetical protein [Sphingobacterium sp. SYP-B4668]